MENSKDRQTGEFELELEVDKENAGSGLTLPGDTHEGEYAQRLRLENGVSAALLAFERPLEEIRLAGP